MICIKNNYKFCFLWYNSRDFKGSYHAFRVYVEGCVLLDRVDSMNVLRPTFFLTSSVQYASGDETISNAIRLKI